MHDFILRAKTACYVGAGQHVAPAVPGAHELTYSEGDLRYLDSYFGGSDFLGREVVWRADHPVWAMQYHGHILRDDLITAVQGGEVIRAALNALYAGGRFLGGHDWRHGPFAYADRSSGDWRRFEGEETIRRSDQLAYRLVYHGGLIRD